MSSTGLSLDTFLCLVFPHLSLQVYDELGFFPNFHFQTDCVLLLFLEKPVQRQVLPTKEGIASSISCGMP